MLCVYKVNTPTVLLSAKLRCLDCRIHLDDGLCAENGEREACVLQA